MSEDKDRDHFSSSDYTPLRPDAFEKTEAEKIEIIEKDMYHILETLGMDMTDDSLKDTPIRVAKMFVREIFGGLNPQRYPRMSVFENKYKYGEMLIEKNIGVYSTCEHHLLPVIGKAHIAYISSGTVIGLSKLNRIVDYFARRPQVQERMTRQIVEELKVVLKTEDVACIVEAKHFCVITRGIEDVHSSTITAEYSGQFKDPQVKADLLNLLNMEDEIEL